MDSNDLKARLLAPRLTEDTVDIPGVGTVRVRCLTRFEAALVGKIDTGDVAALERKILSMGVVDPPMTEAEIGLWQAGAPAGELDPVVQRIAELSGMTDHAAKAAYKSVRDATGAGVRVLPGGTAGDDGGEPAGDGL